MELRFIKLIGFIGLGAGVLLLLTGFLITPGFVANHFSPDGILEESTIQKIQLLRLLAIIIGILAAVPGSLHLAYLSRVNRYLGFVSRFNYIKILKILILLALPLMYIYYVAQHFWTLPAPSDPLLYLEPTIWDDLSAFRFIDRIVVAVGLRLSSAIFSPVYVAGMYYIVVVHFLIITIGVFWCYIKKGFLAGLFAGILLISSYTFLAFATVIFADQTMALFALLAFIFFFSKYRNRLFAPMILAGIFTALTCLSKITGVALLIFFVISIVWEKKWSDFRRFSIGFIVSALVIFVTFSLLFGWDSLKALLFGVIRTYTTGWVAGTGQFSLFNWHISYVDGFLFSEMYLPILLSLVILIGAYRDKLTRNLYLAAISFAVFLSLSVALGGMAAVRNYMYPVIVFGSLGLGIYLATLLKEKGTQLSAKAGLIFKDKVKLIYAVICLVCIFFALKIGINHPTAFTNPAAENVSILVRMAYPIVPLMVIGALVFIEYSKSRIAILLFIVLISLWCPAYNGAFAYNNASFDRQINDFYYKAAAILNEVPTKEFSVYVEDWNKAYRKERALGIYAAFFNEKYSTISYARALTEARTSIFLITDKKNIPAARGNQILTDNPEQVCRYLPTKETKTIPWEGTTLTVLEILGREKYDYESNFSVWNGPDTVGIEELAKTAPPLIPLGNAGDFSFTHIPTKEGYVIRVNLVEPQPTGDYSIIQFGYTLPNKEIDSKIESDYIYFAVSARLSNKIERTPYLYVQDKVENWEGKQAFIGLKGFGWEEYAVTHWEEYVVTHRIRKGATEVRLGIKFTPQSKDEWLEIRNVKIAAWSPE